MGMIGLTILIDKRKLFPETEKCIFEENLLKRKTFKFLKSIGIQLQRIKGRFGGVIFCINKL